MNCNNIINQLCVIISSYFTPLQSGANNGRLGAMPHIDPEKLKERLVYRAPQQASVNTSALRFKRPTNAQIRRANAPIAPKLEPLVS